MASNDDDVSASLDGAVMDGVLAQILDVCTTRQREQPWSLGTTSLALSRTVNIAEALLVRILTHLVEDAKLAHRAGYFATVEFVPSLTPDQRAFFDDHTPIDVEQPLLPASFKTLIFDVRRSKIPGISQALDTLVTTGALVRVADAVYRGPQIEEIRGKLEAALRRDTRISMAGFRDIIGTSRKHAVPLLEWFDRAGVTLRTGDVRILRVEK